MDNINTYKVKPIKESLYWIPALLTILDIIVFVEIVLGHKMYPKQSLKYLMFYSNRNIWLAFLLFLLTISSYIWFIIQSNKRKNILNNGITIHGKIIEIIWKRAWLTGNEWKCQLLVETEDGKQYYSSYYRYSFLNYLSDDSCNVYMLNDKFYIYDYRFTDRKMSGEEKRAGIWGGNFMHNEHPNFPICSNIKIVEKYSLKKSKGSSQLSILFILLFVVICYILPLGFRVYNISYYLDSDHDGMEDYMEFKYDFDPTVPDECFEMNTNTVVDELYISMNYKIPAPFHEEFYNNKLLYEVTPLLNEETIPGFFSNPFVIDLRNYNVSSVKLVIKFDKDLLLDKEFSPQFFCYSYSNQDEGMIPIETTWDGASDYVTINNIPLRFIDSKWRFYLLDGTKWYTWEKEYAEFWEEENKRKGN